MPIVKSVQELNYEYVESLYEKKFFDNYAPKKIMSRRYEEIKVSNDGTTFKLSDREQKDTVSLIYGENKIYHGVEYFEIGWSYSKYPQRGNLTYLFELLMLDFKYKILSDKYHTSPGSKEFWQSLMRKKKYTIYRLNLDSNYKRKANGYKEEEIWGREDRELFVEQPNNSFDYSDFEDNNETEYVKEFIDAMERQIDNIPLTDETEVLSKTKQDNTSKESIRLVAQK